MTAVLELIDVRSRYDGAEVLRGVSLELRAGETLALLGPSGSGKSSIVRLALGLAAPTAGTIRLRGELASEPGRVVIGPEARGLGVVFQDLALWPHLTVGGNLAFPLPRGLADRRDRVRAALDRVGLADKIARYPGELSGGERQRVAIARALVTAPAAVLLDEPLTSLDVVLARELLALLRELLATTSTLHVTHDPRELRGFADRVAVIEAGVIVQTGTLDAVRAQPATEFVTQIFRDLP